MDFSGASLHEATRDNDEHKLDHTEIIYEDTMNTMISAKHIKFTNGMEVEDTPETEDDYTTTDAGIDDDFIQHWDFPMESYMNDKDKLILKNIIRYENDTNIKDFPGNLYLNDLNSKIVNGIRIRQVRVKKGNIT